MKPILAEPQPRATLLLHRQNKLLCEISTLRPRPSFRVRSARRDSNGELSSPYPVLGIAPYEPSSSIVSITPQCYTAWIATVANYLILRVVLCSLSSPILGTNFLRSL